ncbi:hypothetical protein C8R45DRAFT_201495 [Mycena sanguinolenta]|nr:hypothetical protein C8R45DRAFT_201495 [Mycena sanguinolenta]
MPADRNGRSTAAQTRVSGRHTTLNISGGRGGSGGDGHGNGTGGTGGHGMGPNLSFDISVGHLTMHNNMSLDGDFGAGGHHRQNPVQKYGRSPPGPYIHQNIHQHGDRGIDILHRTVALEAIHDAAESFPQPRCHPETRTQMLEALRDWALDKNAQHSILWLQGPAGAGKSAIMQTLCGVLEAAGQLGGSFFYKRGHATRGSAKTLFATIAYQLALSVEWLRTPISQIVEKDPSIVVRSLATQMKTLVCDPCRAHTYPDSVAILIDGLDECEGHDIQQEILHAIRNSSLNHPIPFRFIVASRPEPHIREVFESPVYVAKYRSFNVEQSFHDVWKYLSDEFSRIHHEHSTMADVPLPWPSRRVLETLVDKSSGHFIYAATIIKFIDDKNYRPMQRLAIVLDGNQASESIFGGLDQLYMNILRSSPRQAELVPILCAILHFELQPPSIDELFGLSNGEALLLLRGLHSVLQGLPSHSWGEKTISFHHASFQDFLNDPDRSHNFHVGSVDHRVDLARRFLRLLARQNQPGWSNLFWVTNPG